MGSPTLFEQHICDIYIYRISTKGVPGTLGMSSHSTYT
jgi:hypothetical protein